LVSAVVRGSHGNDRTSFHENSRSSVSGPTPFAKHPPTKHFYRRKYASEREICWLGGWVLQSASSVVSIAGVVKVNALSRLRLNEA
jgi:hypothetical protein